MAVKTELRAGPRKPESDSIPKLFRQRVEEWADRTAMREKQFGLWRDISWREFGESARNLGLGLAGLGLEKGDRVAIISENNPQWLYTDMGTQAAGGITVGIYTTDSAAQVEYVVGHSQARFFVAENEEQLDKILEVRERLPGLEKIIVIDMEGLRGFCDPMVMSFDELLDLGREVDRRDPGLFAKLLGSVRPEETAFLIYTSGTTGPPKGAMITHDNILGGMDSFFTVFPGLMTDEILTFLPLCHIAERGVSAMGLLMNGYTINFAEEMSTVPQDIREVSPTIFFAVPRIWEKFYSGLILRLKEATAFERLAFRWAVAAGKKFSEYRLRREEPPLYLKGLHRLADWAVLRNLKKFIGLDRARFCLSGAAPISPDLLRFYHALGVDIREVYGQTESSGGVTIHYDGDIQFGTVGRPIPGVEVKCADDGEILIKGPGVFKGYFRDPDKTAETVIDGWLHTGDVGRIEPNGHVVITDRKKDIIITAGGKNITPSEIENQLKFCPYINDAVVIGDGRKFLTALIMIDDENVMKYAQDNRVPFTTYASLTKRPEIIKLIQQEVDEVNKKFARVETVKKFRLIEIQLTAEDEEITPTMKLKRSFISKKFKAEIESMYGRG
ncbi:MAG: long-chain fatty acid--CoA ligase [Pseudomonadota bacterium]